MQCPTSPNLYTIACYAYVVEFSFNLFQYNLFIRTNFLLPFKKGFYYKKLSNMEAIHISNNWTKPAERVIEFKLIIIGINVGMYCCKLEKKT